MASPLLWIPATLYFIAAFLLFLFGVNCYAMLLLFRRKKDLELSDEATRLENFFARDGMERLPVVTTQIPIYNEYNVAARVLRAAADMVYPAGRHEIQVLDDSDDETCFLIDQEAERLRLQGVDIRVLRRAERIGYKAGALAEGLKTARGELVAILDADFVPAKDFLLRTVPLFLEDEKLGIVQARWGHLNDTQSLLTLSQAIGIDGHFLIEQPARSWNGLYMNFNGTAGVLRKKAIEDAGGWHADTLTEDIDLSYRMQFKGWNAHYSLATIVPGEIPDTMEAFKSQQFRWAKGSIQTALKLWRDVVRAPRPIFVKLQAFFHLTHYAIHPLIVGLALLALPMLLFFPWPFSMAVSWMLAALFVCSMAGPIALYIGSQLAFGRDRVRTIAHIPFLLCLGIGLGVNNSIGVFEALIGWKSPFVRTPKKGEAGRKQYVSKTSLVFLLELALGIYCALSFGVYLENQKFIIGPFLAVYAAGFLFSGGLSLAEWLGMRSDRWKDRLKLWPSGRLAWASLASAALLLLSAWYGHMGPIGERFGAFLCVYTLFCGAAVILFFALPARMPVRQLALWVFTLAVLCRLLVFAHPVDGDAFRYLWEGKLVSLGINPYLVAPIDPQLESLRDAVWGRVNHPEMAAAYPPGILLAFSMLAELRYDPAWFKAVFLVFDLGTLAILWRLLRLRNIDPRWSLLYALNPVVLISFAGQGHFDSVMVFFMTAAILAFHRKRWLLMYALLGLAVQSKLMAVLLLPFLVRRESLRSAWVFIAVVALPCLPFAAGGLDSLSSLFTFASAMAHNGPVHHPLRFLLGSISTASAVCALLFLIYYGFTLRRKPEPALAGLLAFGALLLLSPTVHFWYIAWLVPFLCFYPSRAWLLLCWTSGFYFIAEHRFLATGDWSQPVPFYLLQWGPVFAVLLHDYMKQRRLNRIPRPVDGVDSISVVIPTLNEAGRLGRCIASLKAMTRPPMEIIVVDGGSSDPTVEIARQHGAFICKATGGRGSQLLRGLHEAKGNITIFVHADTTLAPDTGERIVQSLNGDPSVVGGSVGQKFDASGLSYSLVEILNDMKTALTGISFGDQVQFLRTDAAMEHGLVPNIPLMEDVELSLRMRQVGRTCYLWGGATVSGRKWCGNFPARFWQVIYLLTLFFARRLKGRLQAEDLYRIYYPEAVIPQTSNSTT